MGLTYHIVIRQAVEIPTLKHHLLCPMQVRMNGITVNDFPRFLANQPAEETHEIVASDEYGDRVVIPFVLKGVSSYLPVHSLSEDEWNSHSCPRVTLTNQHLHWDPNAPAYEDQENATTDYRVKVVRSDSAVRGPLMAINQVTASTCDDTVDLTADDNFANVLQSHVHVNISEISNSCTKYGNIKSQRSKQVDSDTLAKRWSID